jgi:hypothetical protein
MTHGTVKSRLAICIVMATRRQILTRPTPSGAIGGTLLWIPPRVTAPPIYAFDSMPAGYARRLSVRMMAPQRGYSYFAPRSGGWEVMPAGRSPPYAYVSASKLHRATLPLTASAPIPRPQTNSLCHTRAAGGGPSASVLYGIAKKSVAGRLLEAQPTAERTAASAVRWQERWVAPPLSERAKQQQQQRQRQWTRARVARVGGGCGCGGPDAANEDKDEDEDAIGGASAAGSSPPAPRIGGYGTHPARRRHRTRQGARIGGGCGCGAPAPENEDEDL